jgi:hypothetical protein
MPSGSFKSATIGKKQLIEEILSSATILPVYETWQDVKAASIFCKNGLIIKPKES